MYCLINYPIWICIRCHRISRRQQIRHRLMAIVVVKWDNWESGNAPSVCISCHMSAHAPKASDDRCDREMYASYLIMRDVHQKKTEIFHVWRCLFHSLSHCTYTERRHLSEWKRWQFTWHIYCVNQPQMRRCIGSPTIWRRRDVVGRRENQIAVACAIHDWQIVSCADFRSWLPFLAQIIIDLKPIRSLSLLLSICVLIFNFPQSPQRSPRKKLEKW